MNRLNQYLDARRARVDRIMTALREFREVQPSYAYQAGFFESQLLTLAADSQESTDTLIRDLQRAVVSTQQDQNILV
jgi:hypothetical protein